MKRYFLILLSLFLFFFDVSSQLRLGYTEGKIIKKNGDTINCLVEMATGYETSVNYRIEESAFAQTISTKEIRCIITNYQYFENILVEKKEKLMALLVKGTVNLYKFVLFNDKLGSPGTLTFFGKPNVGYMIKKDGNFYEIKEKEFKSSILNVLGDCNKVVNKVNNNSYKFEELDKAVTDYNNCNRTDDEINLLGSWISDVNDEVTKNSIGTVELIFSNEGKIMYDIIESSAIQRMTLTYRISGDTIISSQSPQSAEEATKFKFENRDKLILEINGIRSAFLRKIKR